MIAPQLNLAESRGSGFSEGTSMEIWSWELLRKTLRLAVWLQPTDIHTLAQTCIHTQSKIKVKNKYKCIQVQLKSANLYINWSLKVLPTSVQEASLIQHSEFLCYLLYYVEKHICSKYHTVWIIGTTSEVLLLSSWPSDQCVGKFFTSSAYCTLNICQNPCRTQGLGFFL